MANTVSWIVGISLAWWLSTLIELFTNGSWRFTYWLVAGLAVGSGFALNHWIIFRPLRRPFSSNWKTQWFIATMAGWGVCLSLILGLGVNATGGFVVSGLLIGTVVSFPQWLVLRPIRRNAWEWILGHTLAWSIGAAVLNSMMFGLGFVLAGVLSGVISGLVLVRIIRKEDPNYPAF